MIGSMQDVTNEKELSIKIEKEVIEAQEREWNQIGMELHDNVNQILSTTRMFVDMLKPASEEEQKIKEKSIEYLITAIEEIRKLSRELVVPQFREKGLIDSIYSMAEDIQMSSSLRIRFSHASSSRSFDGFRSVTMRLQSLPQCGKCARQMRLHTALAALHRGRGGGDVESFPDPQQEALALPQRQREVLVLRYWSGLSEAQIADAMGISRGTVKSTASRALAALEQKMEGER